LRERYGERIGSKQRSSGDRAEEESKERSKQNSLKVTREPFPPKREREEGRRGKRGEDQQKNGKKINFGTTFWKEERSLAFKKKQKMS